MARFNFQSDIPFLLLLLLTRQGLLSFLSSGEFSVDRFESKTQNGNGWGKLGVWSCRAERVLNSSSLSSCALFFSSFRQKLSVKRGKHRNRKERRWRRGEFLDRGDSDVCPPYLHL